MEASYQKQEEREVERGVHSHPLMSPTAERYDVCTATAASSGPPSRYTARRLTLDPASPRSVTDRDASSTIRQRSGLAGASRCYPQKADGANGSKNGEVVNDRATYAIGLDRARSRNELRRRKLLLQLELLELEEAEEEATTSKMKEAEAWYQATDRLGASAKDKKYYPSACAMRTENPPPGYDRRWTWDHDFCKWVQSLEDSVQKSEQKKNSALEVYDERTIGHDLPTEGHDLPADDPDLRQWSRASCATSSREEMHLRRDTLSLGNAHSDNAIHTVNTHSSKALHWGNATRSRQATHSGSATQQGNAIWTHNPTGNFGYTAHSLRNTNAQLFYGTMLSHNQAADRLGVPRELPPFSGAVEERPLLSRYSDDKNLKRLQDAVSCVAREAVDHLLSFPAGMREAMTTLEARFRRPDLIVEPVVDDVRLMVTPKIERLETVVEFGFTVNRLIASVHTSHLNGVSSHGVKRVGGRLAECASVDNGYPEPPPIGLDYFGPSVVAVGRRVEKQWGVMFTCLTTRAIHLEVAHSLNTSSWILAIRRFIATRSAKLRRMLGAVSPVRKKSVGEIRFAATTVRRSAAFDVCRNRTHQLETTYLRTTGRRNGRPDNAEPPAASKLGREQTAYHGQRSNYDKIHQQRHTNTSTTSYPAIVGRKDA